jgi:hypothetical protein
LRAPLHREYFHLPVREISLSNGCASICDCTGHSIAMFYIQSQKKQLTPSVFVHPDMADKNVQFNLTNNSAQLSSQLSLHSRIAAVSICSGTYFENNKKARANTRMKQKHPKKTQPTCQTDSAHSPLASHLTISQPHYRFLKPTRTQSSAIRTQYHRLSRDRVPLSQLRAYPSPAQTQISFPPTGAPAARRPERGPTTKQRC